MELWASWKVISTLQQIKVNILPGHGKVESRVGGKVNYQSPSLTGER